MKNTGTCPTASLIDIKFRNGIVARCVDPTKLRWEPHPDGNGPSSYDITDWQLARLDAAEAA